MTVVPYGVDLQRFRPGEKPPGEVVTIGAVSRLSPEKGIEHLVEAFAFLRKRFGDRVRLRIAGDGPERGDVEAAIERHDLVASVELAGWLDYDSVPEFLASLDIFALPSTYEGFGVAAVEASACGLPVVASNVHGIPDVVRDGVTGKLVPPADAPALADALVSLVEDAGARRSMGLAGRQYVADHYDWARNARQMELVYERVVTNQHEREPEGDGSARSRHRAAV